jgi:hypothetical protein
MLKNTKTKPNHTMTDHDTIPKPDRDFLATMMNTAEPTPEDTIPPKRKRSSFTVHRIPTDDDGPAVARKSVSFQLHDNSDGNANNDAPNGHKALELTDDLCHELWYGVHEITSMKAEAKRIILKKDATADELLGLERFNQHRATWKRSHIHYTLLAQKQHHGEEFVARVSKRCSGWARETALRQGFNDYCAVNDPLAALFGCNKENYNDFFFSEPVLSTEHKNTTKRKAKEEEGTVKTPERNVRQRTAAAIEDDDFEFEKVLYSVPVA